MSFLHHALDKVGAGFDVVAHYEKGGFYVVLFQCVQNGGSIAVFITGVEGEIEDFLFRLLDIIGVVLRQKIRGGVPAGAFPFS